MEKNMKIALIIFGVSMAVLAGMLWMPLYLAGPDGLEQVTYDLTGDNNYEPAPDFEYNAAPFPDYEIPNTDNGYLESWVVGLIGSAITLLFAFGLFKLIASPKKETETAAEAEVSA